MISTNRKLHASQISERIFCVNINLGDVHVRDCHQTSNESLNVILRLPVDADDEIYRVRRRIHSVKVQRRWTAGVRGVGNEVVREKADEEECYDGTVR